MWLHRYRDIDRYNIWIPVDHRFILFLKNFQDEDEYVEQKGGFEEDHRKFPLEPLTTLLGEEHTQHFPALIHLVIADSAYTNMNINDIKNKTEKDFMDEI